MNCIEHALSFECGDESLLAIVSAPPTGQAQADTGVVIIVGGPQYRVGSHRQFVLLARALAAAGFPVLRFDYRGMGDSTGEIRSFESATKDIAAAIAVLQTATGVKNIALWGLCDGASAALLYCHATQDARVKGLCLLNPWVRSEASLARAHVKHYSTDRLRQKEFWIKLLSGKVAGAALRGLWRNIAMALRKSVSDGANEQQPFQRRMADAWGVFSGSILLLLSGDDYTAKEFLEYAGIDSAWAGMLKRPNVVRRDLPGADHTFSEFASRTQAEGLTLAWLQGMGQG